MKSLLSIPYPRKALSSYFGIVICIGLVVNFILMVFQPFGTASFDHPNKLWILAGYGITIALSGMIFYLLSFYILKRTGAQGWNIVSEILDLFFCCVFSITATYFYYKLVFGGSMSWSGFLQYTGMASSVAALPVLISFAYLYYTWKDVISSNVSYTNDDKIKSKRITLITGQNKSDKVEANLMDLILAKAHDNYVMLYVKKENKVQKHLIRSSLKNIYEQLDKDLFIQSHRSYLVNRQRIKALTGNKSKAGLILSDYDRDIPVSRSMYDSIKSIVID